MTIKIKFLLLFVLQVRLCFVDASSSHLHNSKHVHVRRGRHLFRNTQDPTDRDATLSPAGLSHSTPTMSPSTNITEKCQTGSNGLFGSLTSSKQTISFQYELETVEDADVSDVVLSLEYAMNDLVLSSLFEKCSEKRRLSGLQYLRKLDIQGISTQPFDTIVGETCYVISPESESNCHQVKAALSVFFDSNGDPNSDQSKIISIIKESMDDGSLASTDESIVSIKFVKETPVIDSNSNTESDPTEANGSKSTQSSNKLSIASILIASGASLFVIGGILLGRHMIGRIKENPEERRVTVESFRDEENVESFEAFEMIDNSNVLTTDSISFERKLDDSSLINE